MNEFNIFEGIESKHVRQAKGKLTLDHVEVLNSDNHKNKLKIILINDKLQ